MARSKIITSCLLGDRIIFQLVGIFNEHIIVMIVNTMKFGFFLVFAPF